MSVCNQWQQDIAQVRENLKMQFGSAIDKGKFASKAGKHKSTIFASDLSRGQTRGRKNVP